MCIQLPIFPRAIKKQRPHYRNPSSTSTTTAYTNGTVLPRRNPMRRANRNQHAYLPPQVPYAPLSHPQHTDTDTMRDMVAKEVNLAVAGKGLTPMSNQVPAHGYQGQPWLGGFQGQYVPPLPPPGLYDLEGRERERDRDREREREREKRRSSLFQDIDVIQKLGEKIKGLQLSGGGGGSARDEGGHGGGGHGGNNNANPMNDTTHLSQRISELEKEHERQQGRERGEFDRMKERDRERLERENERAKEALRDLELKMVREEARRDSGMGKAVMPTTGWDDVGREVGAGLRAIGEGLRDSRIGDRHRALEDEREVGRESERASERIRKLELELEIQRNRSEDSHYWRGRQDALERKMESLDERTRGCENEGFRRREREREPRIPRREDREMDRDRERDTRYGGRERVGGYDSSVGPGYRHGHGRRGI